uniref:SJCHGC06473 protein n=1 Tax=Schistosoma japonicum TaxID=6182 RepID=Q5DAI8_SCHJA|nr:SJCHGC06473 protein [Schistosoma japonicum]
MNRSLTDVAIKNHLQAKDLVICSEISTSLDEFKKFLIQQKKHHEELAALSYGHLNSLRDDLKTVNQQVSSSISSLRHTSTAISRLKSDVLKEEKNAGIAHKTSEHGLSIKSDNNELTSYFIKKISDFDTRIRLYKQELEVFEENVYSQPLTPMTPRDLLNVLHQMDNDFISLAAQLYTAHEGVKAIKSNYLKRYRMCYGSARNPFGDNDDVHFKSQLEIDNLFGTGLTKEKHDSSVTTPYGPSPFLTTETTTTTTSTSISGSVEKTPLISTTTTPSSLLSNQQQFGMTQSLQPASSLLPQIGLLTSGVTTSNSSTTSTSLVKPVFGFQSPLTTSTTSSNPFGKIGL